MIYSLLSSIHILLDPPHHHYHHFFIVITAVLITILVVMIIVMVINIFINDIYTFRTITNGYKYFNWPHMEKSYSRPSKGI